MKSKGRRYLKGVLAEDEGLIVLDNTLPGIGWKIVDFRIMPNNPDEFSNQPDKYFSARLSTIGGLGKASFFGNDNQVLGAAWWVAGSANAMFQDDQLITTELRITNMNKAGAVSDAEIAFQIVLEAFSISDYEQVVATIKETAQSGTDD